MIIFFDALLPFLSKATISKERPSRGIYNSVSNVPFFEKGICSPSIKISTTSVLSVTVPIIFAFAPLLYEKILLQAFLYHY